MMYTPSRRTAPWRWMISALTAVSVLAGCASGPSRTPTGANLPPGAYPAQDGPEPHPPPDLERVPDATPQIEPIREGGPNKPYDVLGHSYVPIARDAPYVERGIASWYGRLFHGKRTASGEIYNMYAMTAAHRTLPIPSYVRVRNPANGREVIVRINDRGPFHSARIIDLSYTAAFKLDLHRGIGPVEVQRITLDEIRTGSWRHDGNGAGDAGVAAAVDTPSASLVSPVAPLAALVTSPAAASAPVTELASETAPTPVVVAPTDAATAGPPLPVAFTTTTVGDAPPARAYTAAARGFWVQLGAFRERVGAESFQQHVEAEVDWLAPLLAVFNDTSLFRLQAGPYPTRNEARAAAQRIRDGLKLVPVIVERR